MRYFPVSAWPTGRFQASLESLRNWRRAAASVLFAGFAVLSAGAQAAPGDLDTSFGVGGVGSILAGTASTSFETAVAVQSDGKVVVTQSLGTSIKTVRYLSNGVQDPTFGTNGVSQLNFVNTGKVTALAIQSDGKIVIGGFVRSTTTGDDFLLFRLLSNGQLDPDMAPSATPISTVTSNGSPDDQAFGLAIQADQKIVLVGSTMKQLSNNQTFRDIALVRYNSNGTRDTTFGSAGTGIVTTHIGGSGNARESIAYSVAIQADGKIVVAGEYIPSGNPNFATVRYNSDGTLDTSFGGTGSGFITKETNTCVQCNKASGARGVAIQSDGKIVAAGYTDNSIVDSSNPNNNTTDMNFGVVRYDSAGILDSSFGTSGIVTTRVGTTIPTNNNDGDFARGFGVAIDVEGKIVVAGEQTVSKNGGVKNFALVRYMSNGGLDTGFGAAGTGKVITQIVPGDDGARALAIQTDGKILAAGYSISGGSQSFVVARYAGTPPVVAPACTIAPQNSSIVSGTTQSFTATCTNSPTSYAWKVDGTQVASGAANTFTTANNLSVAAHTVSVIASNSAGSSTEVSTGLTVTAPTAVIPACTIAPLDSSVASGSSRTFTATCSNNPTSYTWRVDGAQVASGVSATYGTSSTLPVGSHTVAVTATNSAGTSTQAITSLQVTTAVAAGNPRDFNADAKSDIMWQNTSGERAIWYMNGGTFVSGTVFTFVDPSWQIAVTADFNGDGKPDLIWQNVNSGERYVWYMNGATLVSAERITILEPAWQIVGAADFNGDGKPDLLWQNVSGRRAIWFMNGVTLISGLDLGYVPPDWQIAATGDFNADSKPDIVWQNTNTGQRAVWFMNGATLTSAAVFTTLETAWSIAGVGDFNGDGKPDLLWQNVNGDRAVWYMDGTTTTGAVGLFNVSPAWSIIR